MSRTLPVVLSNAPVVLRPTVAYFTGGIVKSTNPQIDIPIAIIKETTTRKNPQGNKKGSVLSSSSSLEPAGESAASTKGPVPCNWLELEK